MELEFLRWLREAIPPSPRIPLGIGDDAALLTETTGKQTVVTTDMLMDGVDFRLIDHLPVHLGRKALAVNLSDLAAMGARPVAAFVSFALPSLGRDEQELPRKLIEGLLPLAAEFECPIAGGDTNSWLGPLVISITVIGEVDVGQAWLRSGARPGDGILVTGAFGGSIRGRHLTFTPRVREALQLQSMGVEVHAAIDVSDGLSLDLSRICDASGCGARLDLSTIPIHPDTEPKRLSPDGSLTVYLTDKSPLEAALSDGEDFELILAVPPAVAAELLRTQPLGVPLTQIGWFTAERGLTQQLPDGSVLPLAPRGYEH
jgi:thiamine-monophosphate kinase